MFRTAAVLVIGASSLLGLAAVPSAPDEPKGRPEPAKVPARHMEKLGRGVVAIHQGGGKVFVSWRLLGTDPEAVAFHLYRRSGDAEPLKLTKEPLASATCFEDRGVEFAKPVSYFVRPVIGGKEGDASAAFTLPAPAQPYLSVPLKTPAGYTPNDASVGDLDGDGEKELRIFTTTIPTAHRIYTLAHDPIYRLGVAWQNVAYNQPAHTGFYLGHGMTLPPPRPNITTDRPK